MAEKLYTNATVKYDVAAGVSYHVDVEVINGEISLKEIQAYVEHGRKQHQGKVIDRMEINLDGEFVDLKYHFADVPFDRIRRITGYLVGTIDRFNNAKRAEVSDRVKHNVGAAPVNN